jgi:hypothetical protein
MITGRLCTYVSSLTRARCVCALNERRGHRGGWPPSRTRWSCPPPFVARRRSRSVLLARRMVPPPTHPAGVSFAARVFGGGPPWEGPAPVVPTRGAEPTQSPPPTAPTSGYVRCQAPLALPRAPREPRRTRRGRAGAGRHSAAGARPCTWGRWRMCSTPLGLCRMWRRWTWLCATTTRRLATRWTRCCAPRAAVSSVARPAKRTRCSWLWWRRARMLARCAAWTRRTRRDARGAARRCALGARQEGLVSPAVRFASLL